MVPSLFGMELGERVLVQLKLDSRDPNLIKVGTRNPNRFKLDSRNPNPIQVGFDLNQFRN